MLANQFTEAFRDEHRDMRDALLDLIDAFEAADAEAVRRGVEEMSAQVGPHFHYEREALYPALAGIYGQEYVDELQAEHDTALAAAQELSELVESGEITPADAARGMALVRQLLPHVSELDGISVIVEVLEPEQVRGIIKAREKSLKAKPKLRDLAKRAHRRRIAAAGRKGAAKPKASAAKKKASPKKAAAKGKPARKAHAKTSAPKRRAR